VKLVFFIASILFTVSFNLYAAASQSTSSNLELKNNTAKVNIKVDQTKQSNPVVARAEKENKIPPNFFTISLYKPNYVLPFYYTGSPYNAAYEGQTPNQESLKKQEFKYQFSLKVPAWKNIHNSCSSLYLAYTQLSYWQLYNKNAFFRETDYEPEIFLSNELNYKLIKDINLTFVNLGASHQSNGFGNNLERSWNRTYLEIIFSKNNLMLDLKPWIIINDSTMRHYNPDIGDYLGHGQITVAYKLRSNVFSIRSYNLVEHGFSRSSAEVSWSFYLTPYIKGYAQFFSGYGQSLIEYNHRTNSFGLGVALSDWI
jgi:phospholipase A1